METRLRGCTSLLNLGSRSVQLNRPTRQSTGVKIGLTLSVTECCRQATILFSRFAVT